MQDFSSWGVSIGGIINIKRKKMNRLLKVSLGVVLAVLPLAVNAQDVHWQARGGIGYSTLFGGVSNIDDRVGFHIGGGADIGLSKNGVWRFQPAFQFAQKGWTFDGYYGNEQIMAAKYSTRLNYLQLPLQMAARLNLGKEWHLTFRTGAYVAYGLSAKTRMKILDTDHDETFSTNHFSEAFDFYHGAYDEGKHSVEYPKFNRWDLGAIGGIDLSYRHFIIGYNISVGLTKLGDGGFIGSTVANIVSAALFGGHPKNISAEISVGYQF